MLFLGYVASLAYLFTRISRCGDYFGYLLAQMRVPLMVLALATLAAFMSGRFMNALLSKMGMRFMALTFVFLLSSAFSVWPGGSLHQFKVDWPPNLILFVVLASFVTTIQGLRAALSMLGFGVGLVTIYSLIYGGNSGMGRLDGGGTTYSNPNDLALVMVIGAPALIFIAADSTRRMYQRVLAGALLAPVMIVLLGTGSRGGVLAFIVMAGFLMWFQSWSARIRVGLALAVLSTIAIAAAPGIILKRLTTFMEGSGQTDAISDTQYGDRADGSGEGGTDYTGVAAASAIGRLHLIQQATKLMIYNPVIGAGFSMFQVAENEMAIGEGASRGAWKASHNMYLQMGSENGLLGLGLFLAIAWASWKSYRIHLRLPPRPTQTERTLSGIAFALSASMIGYLVAGTFLTIAYDYFLPMYAALAVAFDNVAALEMQRRRSEGGLVEGISAVEGARGQIDWTRAPAGVAASAQMRQGV